jgi:hypothetical protein
MRLVRTLRDWLAVERERAAFSIHALETARAGEARRDGARNAR